MTLKRNTLNTSEDLSDGNSRVLIIGGGVAGMSCALWLKQLGLLPEIIEKNASLGGQLQDIDRINRWVLGFQGLTSQELAQKYSNHIIEEKIPVSYNSKLVAIENIASGFQVYVQKKAENKSILSVKGIVIATGARTIGSEVFCKIPGFNSLFDAGLIDCYPTDHLTQLESLRGKTVAVIGGGDNAHFTAHDVAMVATQTYLLMRSQPKAQKKIRNKVQSLMNQGRVKEYTQVQIIDFSQLEDRIELTLSSSSADVTKIKVDRVFVRIGYKANSEFLLTIDKLANIKTQIGGYIETDAERRTSIASVYAIGDVANLELQSVVTAIADGAIAARTIAKDIDKQEVCRC